MPRFSEVIEGLEILYETRIFTNQGEFVRELEKRIARELNVRHCALFCNGTIAIMTLMQALDLRGKVLVPSFTFAATTQALLWQRLVPEFVDISRETLTMDPDDLSSKITDDTAAIFPVNIFGGSCDHDRIAAIALKKGLPLIYDSAQAFGTKYRCRPVGSLGDAEVFSFHATKIFHTGEGGAVVTDNTELYQKLCRMRNFGFEGYLNCTELGINGKMSEFAALIGLRLIKHLWDHMRQRKWVFQQYRESLKGLPGIRVPAPPEDTEINYSYFNILIDPGEFGLTNFELYYALSAEKIVTRCYFFPPVHRTLYYQNLLQDAPPDLPNTDWAALHSICLPVYSDMQASELAMIIEGIVRCHRHASEIKSHLSGKVPWGAEALSGHVYDDPYDQFIGSSTTCSNDATRERSRSAT